MPQGGRLAIETANVKLDSGYTAWHEAVQRGDYVAVRVSDTGTGMSHETLSKAIEPFFTTKPVGEGTGLGLSVIYGFLNQSRGHLRLDSELGQGTTAVLYLPRARQNAIDLNVSLANSPRGNGQTILLVEDDDTVRLIMRDVLQDLGYHVLAASDARPAIAYLQSEQPIDLLMSDVVLPHIDGRKLAELARNLRPALKILFVTGYAEQARIRGKFLDAGMDMLVKPFALDALGAKVYELIRAPSD
jgi:CheY-like chemotaxis protein